MSGQEDVEPAVKDGEYGREPQLGELGVAADAGAQAHYLRPAYYQKTYRDRRTDVAYYLGAAKAAGGPVLEYGVGAGRIALPMARLGLEVTGVDLAKPMLELCKAELKREKPEVRARLKLRHGDMRHLRLRKRFALVIAPFNAILHLYTRQDVEAFLARVRSHLMPEGRLLFDYSIPRASDLALDPQRWFGSSPIRHPERDEKVRYAERFEYDPLRQVLLMNFRFTPEQESERWYVPLTHRQFFPQELEALLHYNGFEHQEWSADFLDQKPSAETDTLVVSCRPRQRGRAKK